MHILRVLGSRLLPCGCFVGRYEAFDGSTVDIIDEVSPTCHDTTHRIGTELSAGEECAEVGQATAHHRLASARPDDC